MSKRKQPQNRTPEESPRDEAGRFPPGVSGNPGGVPKQALELRKSALQHAPRALQRAVELMEDTDPKAAGIGIGFILERGLGRPGPPSELPDGTMAEVVDASPSALLSLSMKALGRVLAHLEARALAGHPLSNSEVETLSEAARTLSVLAKEERELAKDSAGAKLSDAELKAAVLGGLTPEELQAELERRRAAA